MGPVSSLARVRVFRNPATRALLATDGLTTPFLEAAVGEPLFPARVLVERIAGERIPGVVRRALHAADGAALVVRRSRLVTAAGTSVSANVAMAATGVTEPVRAVLEDPEVLLGEGLARAGVATFREVLHVGHGRWPQTGAGACARKVYRLWHEGQVAIVVRELFHPAVVDPAVHPATATAVGV